MAILSFLIHLFGATMLLLFAVRMVRTGVERSFGARFRRLVNSGLGPLRLVPAGVILAIVLQSSAAVTLLVAGFAGSGVIAFLPGLSMVIGADLGSALLIQVLSLDLEWLQPVLLTVGGVLFLKTERRGLRQAGRVTLGIALILLSLDLLRQTVEPIRDSGFLPAVVAYLESDFLTAFLAGTTLAFVMHSSVAAILMCVAVTATGALPLPVGVSILLGANLGSALIPVWLSRGAPPAARRIPLANLVLRGSAALLALLAANLLGLPTLLQRFGEAQALIVLHICFNAALLPTLPLCRWLEPPMTALLPNGADSTDNPAFRSVLDHAPAGTPQQALANLRRELLRMAGVLSAMFEPVMDLYGRPDPAMVDQVTATDEVINAALNVVRRYSATLHAEDLTRSQRKDLQSLVDYAIALEAAGDIIVKRLLPLSEEMHADGQSFSAEGRAELEHLHHRAASNLAIATNLIVGSDVESARCLLEEKAEMARLERKSRKHHLTRLAQGNRASFNSSDRHLETAYLLKEFNSWIVTIAHPILDRNGLLLRTRLSADKTHQADAS